MEFQCLPYYGKTISPQLIVKDEDGSSKIFCFKRNIYLRFTPEEKVRQTFLWFLYHGSLYSKSWSDKFFVSVERYDIDISLSLNLNVKGLEAITLFLIIETKENTQYLFNNTDIENQTRKYVLRKNCGDCFLFNAGSAIHLKYDFTAHTFSRNALNDLSELDDLINTLANSHSDIMIRHMNLFNKAKMGDYESFKNLVEIYGDRCTIKFEFLRDKELYQVRGFLFHIVGDDIFYRVREILTKKKQKISKENFREIVSITDSAC